MKKIIILSLAILGIVSGQAQTNAIDKYFDHYRDQESFTKIEMGSKVFEIMAKMDCEESEMQDITEMASQINTLNVIIDSERASAPTDYKNGVRYLEDDYEELMSFSGKEGAFKFFIDENNGIVHELVIFGAGDSTLAIISLTGNMDLKKVGEISAHISTETMDIMSQSKNIDKVVVYPNPAKRGSNITIETPKELGNATIEIYNSQGKLVKTINNYSSGEKINTASLSSDQYVIQVVGKGTTITKKFIIR